MIDTNQQEKNKKPVGYKQPTAIFVCLLLSWLINSTNALAQITPSTVSGQGAYPAAEIAGDTIAPPAVPTGRKSNDYGSTFSTLPEQIPLTIYLDTDTYAHNTHQFLGKRTVLTIRPATLNPVKRDLINGILQLNSTPIQTNKSHILQLDINQNQLEQIQAILAPSANDQSAITKLDPSGNKYIYQDPASNISQSWIFHYLPIVKRFSRYAVLLGIIFATVLLSFAAYGVIMGQRGSGDKVISTASGLIILLMAFTIYRLLISNATLSPNTISNYQVLSTPQPKF